jgi:septal ring factor EnvC (AmiA/AmiB activator)
MKPALLFAGWMLTLGGFVAFDPQAGDGSYEGLVKDLLGTVESLTKTLQTIKDRDSAEAARPELKKAAHKMLDLRKKAEEWNQPNKEEKDRLAKEYAPKFEAAVKQFRDATIIAKGVPGGEDAVAELAILKDKNDKEKDKDKDKTKKDTKK